MSLVLPNAVSAWFAIDKRGDLTGIRRWFTADAIVIDEGKTHQGHAAIEAWLRSVQSSFDYSVEPIDVHADGSRFTVTANLVGNFPGSPVVLRYVFGLTGDRINTLEIA
ncbi:nuclear transport factor 2 family protein [Enterobacter asburiae]|uniref:nuclear transport factor 2 family protein n=1 Tax=unclassified Scandinavium TaxID=2830652 RepID=UPI00289A0C79|nr:nuclear transport factor 2 family protein [Scandinavium sp.]